MSERWWVFEITSREFDDRFYLPAIQLVKPLHNVVDARSGFEIL